MAFIAAFFVSVFALPVSRVIARNYIFSRRSWWGIPAVVYGEGERVRELLDNLKDNPRLGYIPVAVVDESATDTETYRDIPVLHSIEESKRLNRDLHIKMAIIIPGDDQSEGYRHLVLTTLSNFRYNIIIPNLNFYNTISMHIRDINGILGLATTHDLTKWYNMAVKRALDLFMLVVGGIVILPVFGIVAVLVKATSPGPVFYRHKRIGQDGREINVWKFRSMRVDADQVLESILAEDPVMRAEWEACRKLTNDPRITAIGKFLRKSSLDELPQLLNILAGEMSFIGPRPVTESERTKYGENFDYIFSVKPGLGGMWQVSGRSDTDYRERVALDSYYIQNWSLWMDIWLIFKTVAVVFTGKGAR
jgi:exopolysaccharide biosynthesis polyprenyl glycosylphosphotransferase